MKSEAMRLAEERERAERSIRTAKTWAEKGGWIARSELVGELDVHSFLRATLEAAEMVLAHRPPDVQYESEGGNFFGLDLGPPGLRDNPDFEDVAKLVDDLQKRISELKEKAKRERLIAKLESIEGRTPEEAETYLARARALRASA